MSKQSFFKILVKILVGGIGVNRGRFNPLNRLTYIKYQTAGTE